MITAALIPDQSTLRSTAGGDVQIDWLPFSNTDEALDAVAAGATLDAIIIGSEVATPLEAVRRLRTGTTTQFVVLRHNGERAALVQESLFATGLPKHLRILEDNRPEDTLNVLREVQKGQTAQRSIRSALQSEARRDAGPASIPAFPDPLLEQAPMGVLVIDNNDHVIRMNGHASRILGIDRRLHAGTPLGTIVRADLSPALLNWRHGDITAVQHSHRGASGGAQRTLLLRGAAHAGGEQGLVIYIEDISELSGAEMQRDQALADMEHKIAERTRALQESKARLKAQSEKLEELAEHHRITVESANIGTWIWDPQEDRFAMDSLATRLVDPDMQEFVGSLAEFLPHVHPDDRQRVAAEVQQYLRSYEHFTQSYRLGDDDRGYRWVHSSGRIHRDEQGQPIRVAGVAMDMTEMVTAKQALEEKTEELQRSNAALDDFAYIASHDLKEPLRGIGSYAQILTEDYTDALDDEGKYLLAQMGGLVKRMEALINTLLHYSRLGRSEPELEDVDFNEVVDEVRILLGDLLERENARIEIESALPTLRCDRSRAVQILQNLAANGIKYNDAEQKYIRVGAKRGDPCWITVQDNGIGIREDHKDRIFRIFNRLHARDAYGGGTGAGLTITRKMVEMHGGEIDVESTPGEGSTFEFHLGSRDQ